jgi:hypothetical protein
VLTTEEEEKEAVANSGDPKASVQKGKKEAFDMITKHTTINRKALERQQKSIEK